MTAGVLYVHSCPPAMCPHVEWAVAAELGTRARLTWVEQHFAPGQLRAEIGWRGRSGTAGRLAAALRGWSVLRYEVTEDAGPGCSSSTPPSATSRACPTPRWPTSPPTPYAAAPPPAT